MLGSFNIPSVDHLREGVDYKVVDWDFADPAPAAPPVQQPAPGEPCPAGTKMVFGLCRRVNASGEQQVGDDTDQEKTLKQQATKEGSAFENNKAISAGGKKYGWAMEGGKPILVEWGSVAGEKKVGPKKPAAAPAAAPDARAAGGAAAAPARGGAQSPAATPAAPRAGAPMSAADRAAYAAGGGNAASQRGMGSTTEQVVAQGRRNLGRMDQGRGRS